MKTNHYGLFQRIQFSYVQNLNSWGRLLLNRQRYTQAEPIFKAVVNISKSLENSLWEAYGFNNLGAVYQRQGNFLVAESYYKNAVNLISQPNFNAQLKEKIKASTRSTIVRNYHENAKSLISQPDLTIQLKEEIKESIRFLNENFGDLLSDISTLGATGKELPCPK